MSNTLTKYEKIIQPIANAIDKLVIQDSDTMKEAVQMLSTLNKRNDEITEEKEKITKPLNEALKAERGRWKPFETVLDSAITTLRYKISNYQTMQTNIASEAADKIAARTGEGKGKFKDETAIRKMGEIEKPESAISTEAGSVSFMKKPKLKITDETLIPRHYLMVDEAKLFEDLKKGIAVFGAEIEIVMIPRNSR